MCIRTMISGLTILLAGLCGQTAAAESTLTVMSQVTAAESEDSFGCSHCTARANLLQDDEPALLAAASSSENIGIELVDGSPKTILHMIAKFSDETSYPQSLSGATANLNAANDFFSRASFGQSGIPSFDVVFVDLPQTKSWYASKSRFAVGDDARAAALAQGYNYANYGFSGVRMSRIFNGWTGWATGPTIIGGIVIENAYYFVQGNGTGLLIHELGHCFDIGHASSWVTNKGTPYGDGSENEYGDRTDIQGSGGFNDDPGMLFKYRLGWLSAEQVPEVIGGMHRIHCFEKETQVGNEVYGLRIHKSNGDLNNTRVYGISHRYVKNNAWNRAGVQVHWTRQGGFRTVQIDTTYDSGSRDDSSLICGRAYIDRDDWVYIMPVTKGDPDGIADNGDEYIDVVVQKGFNYANLDPEVSLTVSNSAPAVGEAISLTATTTDPNGDSVFGYWWEFGDGSHSWDGAAVQSISFDAAGEYVVRLTVSDGKGGFDGASALITVGGVVSGKQITGTVTWAGRPLPDVTISAGSSTTTTAGDGSYILAGLVDEVYTVTANYGGGSYTAQFTNPVDVTSGSVSGCDFIRDDPFGPQNRALSITTSAANVNWEIDDPNATVVPDGNSGAAITGMSPADTVTLTPTSGADG